MADKDVSYSSQLNKSNDRKEVFGFMMTARLLINFKPYLFTEKLHLD
jgi:hypothetical protein